MKLRNGITKVKLPKTEENICFNYLKIHSKLIQIVVINSFTVPDKWACSLVLKADEIVRR